MTKPKKKPKKTKKPKNTFNQRNIKINLANEKFNDLKIIATTLSSDFFGNKKV